VIFKAYNRYGEALNSYDILKLVALSAMVMDHAGEYFWPQAEWMRAVGRAAFPLFLFLVGYSGVWKIKSDIVLFALVIIVCTLLTGHPLFPFNILATIIMARCVMAWITPASLSPRWLSGLFIISVVWYPLLLWCDYSTLAILFAMCGYLRRHAPGDRKTILFLYATLAVQVIVQYISFHFQVLPACIMLVVTALDAYLMLDFTLRPVQIVMPIALRRTLLWASHNTLLIYALHVIAFMIVQHMLWPMPYHFRWMQ
jgi:hypothetical protein